MNFTRYLLAKRADSGLNQRDFSKKFGFSQSWVNKHENHQVHGVTDERVAKVAEVLNVEPEEIYYALVGLDHFWHARGENIRPYIEALQAGQRDEFTLTLLLNLIRKCEELKSKGFRLTPELIKEVLLQL